MLDIAPSLEQEIAERAEANGMTADQYLKKLIAADEPPPARAPTETPEQTKQRVFALLAKWQAKNPFSVPPGGFKTLAELRVEWAAEDANRTEEERAAEDAFWKARERDYDKRPGVSI